MKMTEIVVAAAAVVFVSASMASAHGSACCAEKLCTSWEDTNESGVLGDPGDTCLTPNAGMQCVKAENSEPGSAASSQAIAGCVDGEFGACIGGASTFNGPEGCVGTGAFYVTDGDQSGNASPTACTNAAVDACCAHDACEPAGESEIELPI